MKLAWLSAGVVVMAALVVIGCKPRAGSDGNGPVTLTYANFPPASTFPCVQMEQWKAEVEKRTAGKVKIQTFPGGTLLNAKNMYDGIDSGVADIGCFAMSYQPGRFPVSEAVDLPLGFTNSKVASVALFDLVRKYNPKEFEKVKIITMFTCPPANFMTSKPAKSLADLKGMQLRVSGTAVDAVKLLGATPVAMPMSDTPDAIQKGVVTGLVSSMEVLKDMGFAAYCPYATRADIHVVTFAVVMNKKKWESLSDEAKKAIDDMARDHARWTGEYVDQHVQESLAWAKEKHNQQLFELPAEERQQVMQLLQPMVEAYVKKVSASGLNGQQIIADIRAIKESLEKEGK
ncbi:MAG TPA: TRAP transporter substrate-binding protein [Tepidisphaeraceae bacterium]|nr:TRAP transporter substrate-binding protein [Tepidisphaeraceae bacterium]